MYKLLKQEGSARRAEFTTNRGTVQTPAFMNVATAAAIKGAVSAGDLKTLGCQIMLSNTYHCTSARATRSYAAAAVFIGLQPGTDLF